MNTDESKALHFLKKYGLNAKRFTKREKRQSKTPDFQVFKENELVFYCEVKSIDKDDFEDLVAQHGFYVRVGKDPIDDIISAKIHKACQQFDAVNEKLEYPNVLIFVNQERTYDWKYGGLQRVVTEIVPLSNGTYLHVGSKAIDGRIKSEKFNIQLYIWIDDFYPSEPGFLFSPFDEVHYCNLRNYFGKDPKQIDVNKIRRL